MIWILFLFALGLVTGRLSRLPSNVWPVLDKITLTTVFLLLFISGTTVGKNDQVFERLLDLGLTALAVSWACVAGSILVAAGMYRWVLNREV
ncbi:lysine exporter LysO family protein [bacterium]|jgi:uncharacterized membrane protein YbjE (DUF340 family)|nr:lysine exporter LysO family protein [bacterium]